MNKKTFLGVSVFLTVSNCFFFLAPVYELRAYADTPFLIQICSNTAAQLNEMEKLITNAEKHSKRVQELNDLVIDKVDRARRVTALAEDQVAIAQSRPEDIESLNALIRDIKNSSDNLEQLTAEYRKEAAKSRTESEKIEIEEKQQDKMINVLVSSADAQARSQSSLNSNAHKTSINTAATAYESSKTNKNLSKLRATTEKNNELLVKETARKLSEEAEMRKYYMQDIKESKFKRKS